MELRCRQELAVRLGAVIPLNNEVHKMLKRAGCILIRDPDTGQAVFWPMVSDRVASSKIVKTK